MSLFWVVHVEVCLFVGLYCLLCAVLCKSVSNGSDVIAASCSIFRVNPAVLHSRQYLYSSELLYSAGVFYFFTIIYSTSNVLELFFKGTNKLEFRLLVYWLFYTLIVVKNFCWTFLSSLIIILLFSLGFTLTVLFRICLNIKRKEILFTTKFHWRE